jgi:hypothetical protein
LTIGHVTCAGQALLQGYLIDIQLLDFKLEDISEISGSPGFDCLRESDH